MKPGRRGYTFFAGMAILGVTCIPLLINALGTPLGASFIWAVGFLPDTIGNLMFSRQAAQGHLLFTDLYTSEPHPDSFFNPLFLALGWLQAATRLFPPLALQLLRLLAGVFLLTGVHRLCLRLFHGTPERRFAFLAVMLTGGLGFLAAVFPRFGMSADIRGPEITTFFSLYHQAHFTAALAIIAFMAVLFISAIERGSIPHAVGAGALYLALVSFHPYDAPVPVAAGALWILLRSRLNGSPAPWKPLIAFALLPLPVLIYDWHIVNSVPVFREFYREGLVARPWPATDYLLGWAFALPFAVIGAIRVVRTRESAWLFPLSWVLVTPFLMFLPTPSARRVVEGFPLFLTLLAARGVMSLRPFASPFRRTVLYAGLVLASLSSLYVMARDVFAASASRQPARQMVTLHEGVLSIPASGKFGRFFAGTPWYRGLIFNEADRYYLPDDFLKVLKVLPSLPGASAVFCVHETGLFIPILAGRPVFTGHFGETLRFREKNAAVHAFMDAGMSDEARRLFLADNGIALVFWELRMERMGKWRPAGKKWLKEEIRAGAYALYRVAPLAAMTDYTMEHLRSESGYFISLAGGIMNLDEGYFDAAVESFSRMLALRTDDRKAEELGRRAQDLARNSLGR